MKQNDSMPVLPDLRRSRRNTVSLDRLPPYSLEAEQGVLGCILLAATEGLATATAAGIKPESFYDLRHQTLYAAMLAAGGAGLDPVTMGQRLKDTGQLEVVGGYVYLSALMDAVPSAANLEYYVGIVVDKATVRRLIAACTRVIGAAYEKPDAVGDLLDMAERDVLAVRPHATTATGIKELVVAAHELIERKSSARDTLLGLSTGLPDLDRLTDGLHPAEFVVIEALTSVGKTVLAVNIAVHNALAGVPVGILSAEMRPVQLVVRSLCSEARVNFMHMTNRDVPKFLSPSVAMAKAPLHIHALQRASVAEAVALARRLYQQHGIKLLVVDYIQRLKGTGDSEEQRVASVSDALKWLAIELSIPVLGLSQVTEHDRGGPTARYSMAIEHDADSVWLLCNEGHREPLVQPVRLDVTKCRDGEIGPVHLILRKEFTRFESAARITPDADADLPARRGRRHTADD